MATGRMLQKRISKSEKLHAMSCDTARLLYTWMLAHLDVNGCFDADSDLVKSSVFPRRKDITEDQVAAYLDEMENVGLIIRYGPRRQYLHYPHFKEKQTNLRPDREGKPDIPAFTPDLLRNDSGVTPPEIKIR